jgi:hypothetical protein
MTPSDFGTFSNVRFTLLALNPFRCLSDLLPLIFSARIFFFSMAAPYKVYVCLSILELRRLNEENRLSLFNVLIEKWSGYIGGASFLFFFCSLKLFFRMASMMFSSVI